MRMITIEISDDLYDFVQKEAQKNHTDIGLVVCEAIAGRKLVQSQELPAYNKFLKWSEKDG